MLKLNCTTGILTKQKKGLPTPARENGQTLRSSLKTAITL